MLMELLSKAATVAMLCFVVSSMLAMGAGLTATQIAEPLGNVRLVALALLANFVFMPICALALEKVLWLDESFGVGLLLLGCAAGAPFLPKLAELAKGNLAFAVGAMVVLMVVTVGYLPIVLPVLLPGVTVNPWEIARSLLVLMLLPLCIGVVLKARYENVATRVKPVLDWLSNVSLILLICLITAANITKFYKCSVHEQSLRGCCLSHSALGSVGCSADLTREQSESWHSVRANATLPQRL